MTSLPTREWDRETVWVAVLAGCASVISFLIYFQRGEILLFGDAVAHINIARRVFDSRTPGPLQLGTVWLPLPHVLMLPLLISKKLWQTGVGGSIPSLSAYVLGVLGIFRLGRGFLAIAGQSKSPGRAAEWFTAVVYGLNPNLLYLQSTAMTESLYLCLFVWTVVFFREYLASIGSAGDELVDAKAALWKCGLCLTAACFTRYDGWFVAAAISCWVILTAWKNSRVRRAASGFVLLAAAAPILWFAYNGIVYRNPLEFANGPYSARAIERKTSVPGFPPHPGTNNLSVAAAYFVKAGAFSIGVGNWQSVWLVFAWLGSLLVLRDRWGRPLVLLWLPVPFYMLSVAYGGVPIFTPDWWPHSLYNIRYGVQLLPALAVFLAVLANQLASFAGSRAGKVVVWGFALLFVAGSYAAVWSASPGCFQEAWVNSRTRLQLELRLARELQELPPTSSFLMYLGGHVGALQDAGIPLRRSINEGNHRVWKQPSDPDGLWERSLADPAAHADFVVALEGDPVWDAVHARNLPVVTQIVVPGQSIATIFRTRSLSQP